jgi:HlyD family secretion protein
VLAAVPAACHRAETPDAYGNFEASEVVVSAETSGRLLRFEANEGDRLPAGVLVAVIDTTQLVLEREHALAQRASGGARAVEVGRQLGVLEVQREIARRAYERTRRLYDQQAATAQQLDEAEREYRVLVAQIAVTQAQRRSAGQDVASVEAQVAQIRDRIAKSRVPNPLAGTVLATYAKAGEFVQPGQPLYKVANLDTLDLRAYLSEPQLALVRIGQRVQVHIDRGGGGLVTLPGTVSWISSTAEFTPTPVQTRDERADLVYAVKVRVGNPGGALKIGMPADIRLSAGTNRDRS